jgi:hypothetical protein
MEDRTPLERIAAVLESLAVDFHRVAERVAPSPASVVGSRYVADRLGMTTVWVAEMARSGRIPANCIVAGTGTGKVWKFDRVRIDRWIEAGRRERGAAS